MEAVELETADELILRNIVTVVDLIAQLVFSFVESWTEGHQERQDDGTLALLDEHHALGKLWVDVVQRIGG